MTHWNVIMVAPPLTITREELDEGLGVLDEGRSALSGLGYPGFLRRRGAAAIPTVRIEAPTAGAATQLVSDLVPFARTDLVPLEDERWEILVEESTNDRTGAIRCSRSPAGPLRASSRISRCWSTTSRSSSPNRRRPPGGSALRRRLSPGLPEPDWG